VVTWLVAVAGVAVFKATDALRFRPPSLYARMPEPVVSGQGCRVVLVGSSPAVFGLSARQLQDATGCRSVNLAGLSIGIQLSGYLAALAPRLRPGDIVVLSDWCWIADCGRHPWPRKFVHHLKAVPALGRVVREVMQWDDGRSELGDLQSFQGAPPEDLAGSEVSIRPLDEALSLAESQKQLIEAHGAIAIFAPPPFLARPAQVTSFERQIVPHAAALGELVGRTRWVGPEALSDRSLFVDDHHASPAGRERWTSRIVSAVRTVRAAP
jgi:hypothetical protein